MLTNRTAVVTGGSRGIGFEVCKVFQEQGATVLAVSRSLSKLQAAQEALPGLQIVAADVSEAHAVDRVVEWVSAQWGKLDILINNAAIYAEADNSMTQAEEEVFFSVMRANLYGPYLCTKRLLPLLLKSDDARIVNVGSRSGIMSEQMEGIYGVSKAALHAMTIAVANDLKGRVAVNVLSPGWVRTDMAPDAPTEPRLPAEAVLSIVTDPQGVTGKLYHGKVQYDWAESHKVSKFPNPY
jgi:NAD(P)-dependent dehydrogenase (short-subunit alcohol dehydrogenase family)